MLSFILSLTQAVVGIDVSLEVAAGGEPIMGVPGKLILDAIDNPRIMGFIISQVMPFQANITVEFSRHKSAPFVRSCTKQSECVIII